VQNWQNLDRGLISQKSRDLFARFPNNPNNELFSNGKSRAPGPRPVDRGRSSGAPGPTVARTEGTVARSPELGLRPLRCTEARRRGRNREREMWGTRLEPHRGSGGTEESGRWRCRMGRRRRSVRGLLRRGEREIGVERGAVKLGEVLAFYRAGGAPRRGGRGD
jgi:hypothetical protein